MASDVQVADLGAASWLKVCFLGLHRSGPASELTYMAGALSGGTRP